MFARKAECSKRAGAGAKTLVRRPTDHLGELKVASPCPARWEEMAGDDRVRFCSQCRLNVYNLSAMTRAQALRLVAETEGRRCVRFFRRADGTILTQDCTTPRMSILIALEDPWLTRELMGELKAFNIHVSAASNGADALEIAGREKPDLIVCSTTLPPVNGWAVLRILFRNGSSRSPLVVLRPPPGQVLREIPSFLPRKIVVEASGTLEILARSCMLTLEYGYDW